MAKKEKSGTVHVFYYIFVPSTSLHIIDMDSLVPGINLSMLKMVDILRGNRVFLKLSFNYKSVKVTDNNPNDTNLAILKPLRNLNMLGLKRGETKLLPHDPEWANQFEREKRLLLEAFRDKIIAIEHIGSTAIPGIPAKPIIDINVAISSLDDIDDFIKRLPDLGYEYMPNRRFHDRQFFPKGPESSRTHHLNLVEISSKTGWKNPLIFRDYLRNNQEDRSAYVRLKTSLAEKYKDNRSEYTERKSVFIKEIINKAIKQSKEK